MLAKLKDVIFWQKLYLAIFLILLALLPVQLGKHFWPDFSYIFGIRHDLLSPILYFLDFLIIGLVLIWLVYELRAKKLNINLVVVVLAIAFGSILSIFKADQKDLASYQSARLLLFCLYALSLSVIVDLDKYKKTIILALALAIFWQSVLVWAQFALQHSLNLWILGERNFSASTPGIALVDLSSGQILRPYGTFPHPNILGGFLTLSIMPLLVLVTKNKYPSMSKYLIFILLVAFLTLVITFSRTAWLALIIMVIFYLFISKGKRPFKEMSRSFFKSEFNKLLVLILSVGFLIFLPIIAQRILSLLATDAHSFALRRKLTLAAFNLFSDSPFIGIGQGQFLPQLANVLRIEEVIRFYQPVHNIFLLRLSETGLIGLVTFIIVIFYAYFLLTKKACTTNYILQSMIVGLVVIGFFDHYLLSLQQGQILFWSVIGISLGRHKINAQ